MSKFNKHNKIVGKVYDLTQENMCLMIAYIEELEQYVTTLGIDMATADHHAREYQNALHETEKTIEDVLEELRYNKPNKLVQALNNIKHITKPYSS